MVKRYVYASIEYNRQIWSIAHVILSIYGQTGQCVCKKGYVGPQCADKCPEGYYGAACTKTCACGKVKCDHVTGNCLNNCPSGWIGEKCDKGKWYNMKQ